MRKYTTLLFDADNTLLDFTAAEEQAIKMTCEELSVPFSEDVGKLYSRINDSLWKGFEKGEIERSQIKIERFRQLKERLGLSVSAESMSETYIKQLSLQSPLIEGAEEMLESLHKKYDMYIVTNGNAPVQKSRLKKSGILRFFSGVFISEEVGVPKPKKEFFDKVLSTIPESDKAKVCIIGDSMSSDILGGINSGIDTCWFNKYETTELFAPTYKAKSFEEILKIF